MSNANREFEACTLDEVADALCYVHGDVRDIWIRMGCAIKNEFGDAGFDVWDSWSAGCDGYNKKQIRTDWRAIKATGGSGTVTIASLFAAAIEGGYQRRAVSADEQKRLAAEAAQRKIEREKEARIEAEQERQLKEWAALAAREIVSRCKPIGRSPYLGVKKVRGYGVLFPVGSMVHVVDTAQMQWQLITDGDARVRFWNDRKTWADEMAEVISFVAISTDTVVLPMVDDSGLVQNVQLIFKASGKRFLKGGRKSGCWHLMGTVADVLIIAEGYATAASIHEATGIPVAVAFDSGNLLPVAKALRAQYPDALFLFAADDDSETEAAGKGNPGRDKAQAAAAAVRGVVVTPDFKMLEAVA